MRMNLFNINCYFQTKILVEFWVYKKRFFLYPNPAVFFGFIVFLVSLCFKIVFDKKEENNCSANVSSQYLYIYLV